MRSKRRWFKPTPMARTPNWYQKVRAFQRSMDLLMPKRTLVRFIQEITRDLKTSNTPFIRYQSGAIEAIQSAAEQHFVTCFEKSYLVMLHSKRVTLQKKDMQLVAHLKRMG